VRIGKKYLDAICFLQQNIDHAVLVQREMECCQSRAVAPLIRWKLVCRQYRLMVSAFYANPQSIVGEQEPQGDFPRLKFAG
jgi:hypothetical protein